MIGFLPTTNVACNRTATHRVRPSPEQRLPFHFLLILALPGAGAPRLAVGRGNLAELHQSLKAAHVFADDARRVLAEERRNPVPDPAAGREVTDVDVNDGYAVAEARLEAHLAGVGDRRVGQR